VQSRMPVMLSRLVSASALACAVVACASSKPPDSAADARAVDLEVPALEIYASGIDRFSRCPPAGNLGQAWIPASVTDAPHDSAVTEHAIEQTLKPFRSCYTKGSLHHLAADGRAAIVVRVGPDGKKTSIENYATCGLPIEVVDCMVAEVSQLPVEPPSSGIRTVVIPAVFAPRNGYEAALGTAHDAYAAAAHVTLEDARPGFHACERAAGREPQVGVGGGIGGGGASASKGGSVQAQGVFTLQVDAQGRVVNLQVEPWSGPNELKACVSAVVGKLVFPSAPEGGARILARIAFNPRTR